MNLAPRLILTAALIAGLAAGEFRTPKGKTYHTHRDCIALRAGKALEISADKARAAGLKLCGICARRKGAAK